jgi:hypothetical protein
LTNRLHRKLPVPDVFCQLADRAKPLLVQDELLATELGDILAQLANFRAASQVPLDTNNRLPILRQLNSQLTSWVTRLPSSWRYQDLVCVPGGSFLGRNYHKYPSFTIAATWNQYRVARCLANEMLLAYLEASMTKDSNFNISLGGTKGVKDCINTLCNDICASVPYFLGQSLQNDAQQPSVGALEIMWGLYTCSNQLSLSKEQRNWALGQLDMIGHGMGVLQAAGLASMARSNSL